MYELWLFLHVMGAIIAFGFGFYAPVFGAMSAREPQHGNWYLRAGKRISSYLIIPFALSMFVTGTLLVNEIGGFRRFEELWLALSLVLYVIALGIALFLQRPALDKVVALTSSPPGPEGPPAEVPGLLRRMQLYGVLLLALTIVIVALMVWKPQL
jgi:uncharacterized membrane protein